MKTNHDIRYEIMTEGMKKKKVKKICGQSGPQMYLITEVMNSWPRIWFYRSYFYLITTVMKWYMTVMKSMTARDEIFHDGGYNFMPSERSTFQMCFRQIFKEINWISSQIRVSIRVSPYFALMNEKICLFEKISCCEIQTVFLYYVYTMGVNLLKYLAFAQSGE